MMATIKVMAGIRLNMAETKVAEVYTKLCRYMFWPIDPLQQKEPIRYNFLSSLQKSLHLSHFSIRISVSL